MLIAAPAWAAPDLVVAIHRSPASARPGEEHEVEVWIANAGDTPVSRAFEVELTLALAALPSSGDPTIGSESAAPLAPGQFATLPVAATLPRSLAPGPYAILAAVDVSDVVSESDETNNRTSRSLSVRPADTDLALDAIVAPAAVTAGDVFAVTARIVNRGGGDAENVQLAGFLADAELAAAQADLVPAYGTVSVQLQGVAPRSLAPGTHPYRAVVDPFDRIAETDETNNGLESSIASRVTSPTADLVVTQVQFPPSAGIGQSFPATATLLNQGAGRAGPSRIAFLLSDDSTLSEDDLRLSEVAVPAMEAGDRRVVETALQTPQFISAATQVLGALADADEQVGESNERNNGLTGTAFVSTVPSVNLIVDTVAGPLSTAAGAIATVTASVRNSGSDDLEESFLVQFGFYEEASMAEGPVAVLGIGYAPRLAAGQRTSVTAALRVPPMPVGRYFLGAMADFDESIRELRESDNGRLLLSLVSVSAPQADIAVSRVQAPAVAAAGESVVVTVTMTGVGAAEAVPLDVFAARGPLERVVLARAKAGDLVEVTVPLGELEPDEYTFGATADPAGLVTELDESNNSRLSATVTRVAGARADIEVTQVMPAVSACSLGETFVTTVVARNGGDIAIDGPISIDVELAGTGGQVLVAGRANTAGLAVGESRAVPVLVTALATGVHRVIGVADAQGRLLESDESDNRSTAAGRLDVAGAAADLTIDAVSASGRLAFVSVRNAGTGPVLARFGVTLSVAGVGIVGEASVGSLAASERRTLTLEMFAGPGRHELTAAVDPANLVAESDENNNQARMALEVAASAVDLAATRLSVARTARVGRPFGVMVELTNRGTADAPAFDVALGAAPAGQLSAQRVGRGLRAGETVAIGPLTAFAPAGEILSIRVDVDSSREVAESDESNNSLTVAGPAQAEDDHPDGILDTRAPEDALEPLTLPSPGAFERGGDTDAFQFAATQGDTIAVELTEGSVADFEASLYGPRGELLASGTRGAGPVTAPAGGTYRLAVHAADPGTTGTYAIRLLAGPGKPDLAVTSVDFAPDQLPEGQTLSVTIGVANLGTAPLPTGVRMAVSVENDSERFLLGRTSLPEIGASSATTVVVIGDARIAAGSYRVAAASETGSETLPEGDETNNSLISQRPLVVVAGLDDHPASAGETSAPRDSLQSGAAVPGELEKAGDVDVLRLEAFPGRGYALDASGEGLELDAAVLGPDGATVLASVSGEKRVAFTASLPGTHFARVSASSPLARGRYLLRLYSPPPLAEEAGTLSPGRTERGEIAPAGDSDIYRFAVRRDVEYRLELSATGLALELLDAAGSSVLQSGESALAFRCAADGERLCRVRGRDAAATSPYTLALLASALPNARLAIARAGDFADVSLTVAGNGAALDRVRAYLAVEPALATYEGRYWAGAAASGLHVGVEDRGGGLLCVTARPAEPLAARRPATNGTLATVRLRTLAPGDGAVTLLHAELGTSLGETVTRVAPVADAGVDERLLLGVPARLDGRLSFDPGNPAEPLVYRWTALEAPAPVTLDSPASAIAGFTPAAEGVHRFCLVVSNGALDSRRSVVELDVRRPGGAVAATALTDGAIVPTGSRVRLDGTNSWRTGTAPLAYDWKQPEGPAARLSPGSEDCRPDFVARRAGLYTFELRVSAGGAASPLERVSVLAVPAGDTPPQVVATDAIRVTTPASVTLRAELRDPDVAGQRRERLQARWRQVSGPAVGLDAPVEGPGALAHARAAARVTADGIHRFECSVLEIGDDGRPNGVESSRIVDVLAGAVPDVIATASPVKALPGETVRLTASPDAGNLVWRQLAGPPVELVGRRSAAASFISPAMGDGQARRAVFELFADDGRRRGRGAQVEVELLPGERTTSGMRGASGVQFLGLPVAPLTRGAFDANGLLEKLGGGLLARLESGGRFLVHAPGLGTRPFLLEGARGYVSVRNGGPVDSTLTGTAWPEAVLTVRLARGLNLVAFPLGVPATYSLADLARASGSQFVAYTEEADGRSSIRVFLEGLTPNPPVPVAGKGYLLSVAASGTLTLPSR